MEDYSAFLNEVNSLLYSDKDEPNEHYDKNNTSGS